jgi:hypothetical protein
MIEFFFLNYLLASQPNLMSVNQIFLNINIKKIYRLTHD